MLGDMELLMRYLILELGLMMMRMEEERLVGVMMLGARLVKRSIHLLAKVGWTETGACS
jgi:hypothetical protein